MQDTIVLLSYLFCPLLFAPNSFWLKEVFCHLARSLPTLCQANYGKALAASGLAASSLVSPGSVAFQFGCVG